MISQIIENILVPSSDYIYGFAKLDGLLDDEYRNYPAGISIGKRLDNEILDPVENGPTLEYYNHYRETNKDLTELSIAISNELKKLDIKCIPVVPTFPMGSEEFKPYLKTLRYKISHKMIATRAGLGWIGKTDLFISREFGPRLRLVSILIDRTLNANRKTIDRSLCGNCDICVVRCPAHAANGMLWDINTDRDLFFDANKCRGKCGELGKLLLKKDLRICGICVSVCPLGKRKSQTIPERVP